MSDDSIPGVLAGGPLHGKRISITPGNDQMAVAEPPKPPPPAPEPPSRWHLLRRLHWKPPIPPESGPARMLLYCRKGRTDDGTLIYWFSGVHDPAPPPVDEREAMRHLVDAVAAADPRARCFGGHWVMGLDWYKALRRYSAPGGNEDEWVPQAGDCVLGIPVEVSGLTGAPQLVTDREPQP